MRNYYWPAPRTYAFLVDDIDREYERLSACRCALSTGTPVDIISRRQTCDTPCLYMLDPDGYHGRVRSGLRNSTDWYETQTANPLVLVTWKPPAELERATSERAFLHDGARVIALDRSAKALAKLASEKGRNAPLYT